MDMSAKLTDKPKFIGADERDVTIAYTYSITFFVSHFRHFIVVAAILLVVIRKYLYSVIKTEVATRPFQLLWTQCK